MLNWEPRYPLESQVEELIEWVKMQSASDGFDEMERKMSRLGITR
jgi:hypothetical protein